MTEPGLPAEVLSNLPEEIARYRDYLLMLARCELRGRSQATRVAVRALE